MSEHDVEETEAELVVDPPVTVPESAVTYWVYLAGPMTNIPEFNFPAFYDATEWLRANGWGVFSPAEKDLEQIPADEMKHIPGYAEGDIVKYVANSSFTLANAMEWDLPAIQKSNGIVLLPGWERSTGARYERCVAEALDRDVWLLVKHEQTDEQPASYELVADDNKTQLTDYLRGFGTPQVASEEQTTGQLVTTLKERLGHVPTVRELLAKLEATVVL
jgi:hypothetical protein